jgi:acyl-CoA synthetase (AMP-forming)/AMP-acid ligase II
LALVAQRAASDEPAVITADGPWSGRELLRRAAGAVDFLDDIGAPAGEPVAALLTSTPSTFALTIAAAATDRALAPLGPRLTVAELAPCVDALAGSLLVAEPEAAILGGELAASTRRRLVILPEIEASGRALPVEVAPERPAAILHTSGTTGRPKAVRYTHGPLAARVAVNAELVRLGPGAVYATASPFHHIAGLGMLFVALGSGAALLPMPRFDLGAWNGLRGGGVTHALVVPAMLEMLLDAGALALPGLRVLQYGASPIRPETLARAIEALPAARFVNIFGQTEGSPITCLTAADHARAAAGRPDLLASVGRAAPGVEVVVYEPDANGIGEVHARASHFFSADDDGWLRTGDLGRLDDEGFLFLAGRKDDRIIRGGENVHPAEVEAVLGSHDAVADVCVFGVPDARLGQVVAAAVVARRGRTLPPWEELRAFARQRLGGFKVPERWQERIELPKSSTGKVLRGVLVAEHAPDLLE